jgi:hypothetical protein
MNARYKHLLGNKGIDVQTGQFWIRDKDVSKINNPLNIEIVAMPDEQDERFYVRDVARNTYIFFFREDIVNNYEPRIYNGPMDLNEQIYEILGGRRFIDKDGNRLYAKSKKRNDLQAQMLTALGIENPDKPDPNGIPDYCNTPKLADLLLHSLEKFNPKVKVRMGKYTVYLDKPYSGSTREEAICKAWIDKNL